MRVTSDHPDLKLRGPDIAVNFWVEDRRDWSTFYVAEEGICWYFIPEQRCNALLTCVSPLSIGKRQHALINRIRVSNLWHLFRIANISGTQEHG